jgi:aminopeptidase N
VQLSIPKGDKYFGKTVINFNLSKIPETNEPHLFLDFFGTNVGNLMINYKQVQGETKSFFNNGMIILNRDYLQVGHNQVSVEIINNYRNDGYGLHSFTDRVDMHQYLYTQFEPNYAHYVFPCFDQPDVRAKWALSTLAPRDWSVISNEYEDKELTNTLSL